MRNFAKMTEIRESHLYKQFFKIHILILKKVLSRENRGMKIKLFSLIFVFVEIQNLSLLFHMIISADFYLFNFFVLFLVSSLSV